MEDEMNTYNSLINNLEALELNRIKENIDKAKNETDSNNQSPP